MTTDARRAVSEARSAVDAPAGSGWGAWPPPTPGDRPLSMTSRADGAEHAVMATELEQANRTGQPPMGLCGSVVDMAPLGATARHVCRPCREVVVPSRGPHGATCRRRRGRCSSSGTRRSCVCCAAACAPTRRRRSGPAPAHRARAPPSCPPRRRDPSRRRVPPRPSRSSARCPHPGRGPRRPCGRRIPRPGAGTAATAGAPGRRDSAAGRRPCRGTCPASPGPSRGSSGPGRSASPGRCTCGPAGSSGTPGPSGTDRARGTPDARNPMCPFHHTGSIDRTCYPSVARLLPTRE